MLVQIKDLLRSRCAPTDPRRALEVHFFCAVKPRFSGKTLVIQDAAPESEEQFFDTPASRGHRAAKLNDVLKITRIRRGDGVCRPATIGIAGGSRA